MPPVLSDDRDTDSRPPMDRLTTGSPQLDSILGGGFPTCSINIVMGEPGSGKTILVERLMFANARRGGRPIVFLTTLSEPLDKVVRYLQQFDFYDEELLGNTILYESIGDDLAAHGIGALASRLRDLIITHSPKIVVIDSFKAIHDLGHKNADMRLMLYEVAGLLTACDTTAFLIGEYQSDQIAYSPEFAVADGMVQLTRNMLGHQDQRFIRVLKLRGSTYREGHHAFAITPAGIQTFPRLVSPGRAPDYTSQANRRLTTGVVGLDGLLGGGIRVGRSTFVVGSTGSGKTTLGLQFVLEGLRRGESCLHVSLEENPTAVAADIAALGGGPGCGPDSRLERMYFSPVELRLDRVVNMIFEKISQGNISRLVIDAVGDLLAAAGDEHRLHAYLYALAQHFVAQGVTAIFTYQAVEITSSSLLSALADNIISLGITLADGRAQRWVRVVKVRGADHDMHEHPLVIDGHGARVG